MTSTPFPSGAISQVNGPAVVLRGWSPPGQEQRLRKERNEQVRVPVDGVRDAPIKRVNDHAEAS